MMDLLSIAPVAVDTVGTGVKKITDGTQVMLNSGSKKQSNDAWYGSYLPEWDWLDDVGSAVGNVAATAATAWAQAKAGSNGPESTMTSQGNIGDSNFQGDPKTNTPSFYEKNKMPIMIAGGVAGIALLLLALKK